MGYLIDILVGAASRIVTGELGAHVGPLARWIIGRAVTRLPADDRDRFQEEWLAHLDETPGTLRKLWHAIGCHLGASKVAGVLDQQTKSAPQVFIGNELMDMFIGEGGLQPEEFVEMAITAPEKLVAMGLQVASVEDLVFVRGSNEAIEKARLGFDEEDCEPEVFSFRLSPPEPDTPMRDRS